MADAPSWLSGLVGLARCSACGSLYRREDLHAIGQRGVHWFVRCTCRSCGREGTAVVMVQTVSAPPAPSQRERPTITEDDVLSVYDLLRDYTGNIDGLIGAGSPRTR